jgi:chloramphenicol O-acetyltransferase type A
LPQSGYPPNSPNIPSDPWLDFFEPDISLAERNLQPMSALGKFTDREGKTDMPLSMRLCHAVRDGYHAGQYAKRLQALANDCKAWF